MKLPKTPTLWDMPDEELIEELSRNGWDWDDGSTQMQKEIALIQEALRRILAHVTDEKVGINQFECMYCGGVFPRERAHRSDNMAFCSKRCIDGYASGGDYLEDLVVGD